MEVKLEPGWKQALQSEFDSPYFAELAAFVKAQYREGPVFPAGKHIFRALDLCPLESVRVVILGQDPYHGQGQANGLCFSVNEGVAHPPSLVNIFSELKDDLGRAPSTDGTLEHWARQGVLLLNATLTVRSGAPTSHAGKGWEVFTDAILKKIAMQKNGVVFILWGGYAQKKAAFINPQQHLLIKSPHPSPLSSYRGFFGSKPFSRTNHYLSEMGAQTIDW